MCGNRSKNGREIPASAFKSEQHVKTLYDQKHVFLNHLPAEKFRGSVEQQKLIAKNRNVEELAGVVTNVRFESGQPRADIETAGCPKGELLRQLASSRVPNVGLSHVAQYRTRKSSGNQVIVEAVEDVATVDVVVSPATTYTFREQTEMDELLKAQTELATAQAALVTSQSKIAQLETDLRLAKEQATATDTKLAAVSAERDSLTEKIVAFEQKEAIAATRLAVEKQLKDVGLVPGSDTCSTVFVEQLVSVANADQRKALIEDRLSVVKGKVKTRERGEASHSTDKDVVAQVLSSVDLFHQ